MYYLIKIPIPLEYPLHYSMQKLVKRSHRDHLNRAHLCAAREHVSIMLDRRITVVIYDRLHLHPHGDDTTKDLEQHHSKLKSAGILSKIVSLSEDYFHGEDLVVYREGNKQLSSFSKFSKSVVYPLVRLLLNSGTKFKRKDCRVEGNNYRVFMGYGRYQKRKNQSQRNTELPPIQKLGKKLLSVMNSNLKCSFGDLLKECQDLLRLKYPEAYKNEERNQSSGNNWSKSYWPNLPIFWEFIDINIRSSSLALDCHLDYMNDNREGYTHCLVFSKVVIIDGESMRLSIVMTSRKLCGSAFEKLK